MINLEKSAIAASALPIPLIARRWLREIDSRTYDTVLVIQTLNPNHLQRSWTQETVMLEDALGRVTPVHLELIDSWEVGIVQYHKKSSEF